MIKLATVDVKLAVIAPETFKLPVCIKLFTLLTVVLYVVVTVPVLATMGTTPVLLVVIKSGNVIFGNSLILIDIFSPIFYYLWFKILMQF